MSDSDRIFEHLTDIHSQLGEMSATQKAIAARLDELVDRVMDQNSRIVALEKVTGLLRWLWLGALSLAGVGVAIAALVTRWPQ